MDVAALVLFASTDCCGRRVAGPGVAALVAQVVVEAPVGRARSPRLILGDLCGSLWPSSPGCGGADLPRVFLVIKYAGAGYLVISLTVVDGANPSPATLQAMGAATRYARLFFAGLASPWGIQGRGVLSRAVTKPSSTFRVVRPVRLLELAYQRRHLTFVFGAYVIASRVLDRCFRSTGAPCVCSPRRRHHDRRSSCVWRPNRLRA